MEQRKRVRQWQGALREEMSNLPRESPWPIPTRRILVRQIRDEDAPYEGDNIIHSWEVDLDLFDGSLDLSELALDIEEDYVVKCPNPPQYWN
ncbi:hypothetical protein DXG03_003441 [Asterophora parasitica]|uniref:Uncharacterized protein n=1 Tax=Asterophora parasitica TaxID=117018 RepID=A0A9P7K9F1_9AGAR|nr:hypothetical protein DXG03_003441 [Asterophora parasitica]